MTERHTSIQLPVKVDMPRRTVERDVPIHEWHSGPLKGRLAVYVAAMDCVNATNLCLTTLEQTGEVENVDFFVLVDDRSRNSHNIRLMRKFVEKHGGVAIRSDRALGHGNGMALATHLGYFDEVEYIQFVDNDVEYLRSGLANRLIGELEADGQLDAVGHLLPWRRFEEVGDQGSFQGPPTIQTLTLFRAPVWRERCTEYGPDSVWDFENRLIYDAWSVMVAPPDAAELQIKTVDYLGHHAKHWPAITWGRRKGAHTPQGKSITDVHEGFYTEMTARLKARGVPEEECFDDAFEPNVGAILPLEEIEGDRLHGNETAFG